MRKGELNSLGRRIHLPYSLKIAALILFSAAFLDPHFFIEKEKTADKGLAIYLVLDHSSSMAHGSPPKIERLKEVTKAFIENRNSDMLGLVSFARGAKVLSPLTLDYEAVLQALQNLDVVQNDEQDGTSIGYAVYKTSRLIEATRAYAQQYEIKDAVMILVTDGLQAPSALDQGKRLRTMDITEAVETAKKNKIRLYVINVDPRIASAEFSLERKVIERAAEETGGKLYITQGNGGLKEIYQKIDQLEKSEFLLGGAVSKEMLPHIYQRVSFYPYLIGIGMVCLFLSLLLEGVFMRRVP